VYASAERTARHPAAAAATSFQRGGLPQRQRCIDCIDQLPQPCAGLPQWLTFDKPRAAAAMCRITSMAHAQCTKQLSRLRPSAHAFISCVASTLQWPASTFRGNKQREILKSSNGMKTFNLQAFALHGSRCMLTHFSGANIEHWTQNSMQYFSGANIATLDPETASASA